MQDGGDPGPGKLAQGFKRDVVAALHVADAGAIAFIPLAPERVDGNRAHRMHRIEMPHDQDARLTHARMRQARAQHIAHHHARGVARAGNTLNPRAQLRQIAGGKVQHPVDRRRIPGGAFALHPAAQTGQHGIGVERKIGRIGHVTFSLWPSAKGRKLAKSQWRPGAASIRALV